MNQIKQLVRGCVAKLGIMLEHNQLAYSHLAASSRMVVLEHVDDCRPQQFKVSLRESGRLAGEICGNIAFRTVQTVRHDVLAAHFGALFLRVSLGGDGNTRDGDFLRNNRIHTAGKAKLHRTAHLSAVECTLDKGGHNRTECANIVEILAHKVAQLAV